MGKELTVDVVQRAIPPKMKVRVTQDMVDKLNNLSTDPLAAEAIRENFISYTHVLRDSKNTLTQYLDAIKYVSYKLMEKTNRDSWMLTFPEKYQKLISNGADDNIINGHVASYNKGKLVNSIMEQVLVPSWVINQPLYQKALNVQAELMLTAKSEKVRSDAANSILTHVKKPETQRVEMDISHKDNSGLKELNETLLALAETQQDAIRKGASTKEIAHTPLEIIDQDGE